ncbi:hypothetical protein BDA99DRAFT_544545 [Phascolomyces articulosus]|uniref:Uncharacterized protein n=1 Tax=Phascolomyces articulosus TaxID=60185 RepID=A0AAD5P6P5_9FUNG|nr:hypothetical protein BDA99DRAFT_544545 [Phascolomyces articulosus]
MENMQIIENYDDKINYERYKNTNNNNDVMAMDGGYTLFINKFIELSKLKNKEFENNNFVFPICKDNKIKLTEPEKHFNNVFGSFQSKIENQFAELETENFEFPSKKNIIDIVITNKEIVVKMMF